MRIEDLTRFPDGHPPSPYPIPMPLQRDGVWGQARLPAGLELVAVGWLGTEAPSRGEVPPEVLDRLVLAYRNREKLSDGLAGWHDCEMCTTKEQHYPDGQVGPIVEWRGQPLRLFGHGHHLIRLGSVVYICPVLILHYILEHRYQPPGEFLTATTRGVFLGPTDLVWQELPPSEPAANL